MAWQYGVAQTVAVTFYSAGEPTAPTGALSATISKDGGGFAAIGGTVAQIGATACALLSLAIADTTCDAGVVKITDAGGTADDRYVEFTTEAEWTTTDDLVDDVWDYANRTLTSITALAAQIAAAVWNALRATYNIAGTMGAGMNSAAASGNITLSALTTSLTVTGGECIGEDASIAVVRDDDNSLQITWEDHDITGYTIYLTVRPDQYSTSADDTDALFQVEAALTTPEDGVFTFAVGKAETDQCEVEATLRYDIQAISDTGAITTLLRGNFTVTGDVTRRTTT